MTKIHRLTWLTFTILSAALPHVCGVRPLLTIDGHIYSPTNPDSDYPSRALLEPQVGAYFGTTYNNSISIQDYTDLIGFNPTTVGTFVKFPMQADDLITLQAFLSQVATPQSQVSNQIRLAPPETSCSESEDSQDFGPQC